ncbi:Paramyosin [Lasiodiplodia hormozganensis]|uniref:Paramyosin n=1 Tax=Lasiodiplodia hormozganensis TaxID=869390 RepID=A0AA39Y0C9_9PEZI|nr:Paramyosin [Lasiodiplodia hormozganensis]
MSTSLDFVVDFINTHHASLSAFAQKADSNDPNDSAGLNKALCEHADRLKAVLTKAQCLESALMKREQGYIAEVDNLKAQLEDQRRKTVDANNLAEQHVKATKLHQEKIQDLEAKYQDMQKDVYNLREQLTARDVTIVTLQKDCIARLAEYMEQQPRHSSEEISNSVRTLPEQQPHPTLAGISSSVKDALAQQPHLSLADVSSAMKKAFTDMQNGIPIKLQLDDTAGRASATSLTLQDLQTELKHCGKALLKRVSISVGEVIKEQSGKISKGVQDVLKQVKDRLPNIMSAKQEDLLRKAKSDMERILKDGVKNDGVGLTPNHQTAPKPRGIKRERESVTPEYPRWESP